MAISARIGISWGRRLRSCSREGLPDLRTGDYVTHAHGDHFFGLGVLQDRFPQVRALATPDVVKGMYRQISPDYVTSFWKRRLPGQIPEPLTVAEELRNNEIDLEGHKLIAVNLGHTDTADTTCLHIPSIRLVAPETPSTTAFIHTLPRLTSGPGSNGSTPSARLSH